jgi:NiFe hydrogenase small subunit HydA
VSFLNRISEQAPETVADVLLEVVVLGYHPTLMAASGAQAVAAAKAIMAEGGYLLVVEGGVPTAFGGAACFAWTVDGQDVTFLEAVRELSSRAAAIACVGNCASFGGVAAAGPNPTGVQSVAQATGKPTVNVAGCPAHPDWIAWTVAQVVTGASIPLDGLGRPVAIYAGNVHEHCPRREAEDEAGTFGVDRRCLKELGCCGPITSAPCPDMLWNGRSNWCVDANAPCIGCTEPSFPRLGLMTGEVEGGEGGEDD